MTCDSGQPGAPPKNHKGMNQGWTPSILAPVPFAFKPLLSTEGTFQNNVEHILLQKAEESAKGGTPHAGLSLKSNTIMR